MGNKNLVLYKYMKHQIAIKMLQNNEVCFTQPKYFNDPFEITAAYPVSNSDNSTERRFHNQKSSGKRESLKENYAILSLTRSPLNPLMWAHYGQEHSGIVIGIDVNSAGFSNEENNTIPVHLGNVIYTNTKPNTSFMSESANSFCPEKTEHFPKDCFEELQRAFLHKPICWSYEEEVRVVKCVYYKLLENCKPIIDREVVNEFSVKEVNGRKLFLYSIPQNTIREVYIGVRNKYNRNKYKKEERIMRFAKAIRRSHKDCQIYVVYVDPSSWELVHVEISS